MGTLWRRVCYLLQRRRLDRELAGDMEFHREMAAGGGDGRRFGSSLRLREEAREVWGWIWLDRLGQDVRYAGRQLRKSPGFTIAAIVMLALGVGANVAAFGFFDLMVLRPMNVREPATLLRFHRRAVQNYAYALPYPEMAFFRNHSTTLAAVLGLNTTRLTTEGEPKPIQAAFVTSNFFEELGARMQMGRAMEAGREAGALVVLSHGFWERHFGADWRVVGKTIRLNDKPATIVGVAGAEFSGMSLDQTDLWTRMEDHPYFVSGSKLLTDFSVESPGVVMWGRLRSGVTPRMAEEELRSLAARLRTRNPKDIWEKEGLVSAPGAYASSLTNGNRRGTGAEDQPELFWVLGLIAALCLLILAVSCGNVGSLLLARGVAREREISIRVAIGAGAGRLLRQLFTESVLLGLLGAGAGMLVGYLVLRMLMLLTGAAPWLNATPDWRVVVFAVAMGFAAAVLFGLAPAWQAARQRHRSTMLRQGLVCGQVAASCVLLIVSALLVRALNHAAESSPGFEYEHVLTIDPALAKHGYTAEKARAYLSTLQTRLRSLAGVESVALTLTPPLGHISIAAGASVEGRDVTVQVHKVDRDFFQTMKIPIVLGRNLQRDEAHAVVVGESLARGSWPGQNPLGKRLTIGEHYSVVGVSGSARLTRPEDSDSVEVYLPVDDGNLPAACVLVRTSGKPEEVARSAATLARAIDPAIFPQLELMKISFRQKLRNAQSTAVSVGALGSLALLLACGGIVGLVAFAVSQRTKEIGIRVALGAKPGHVLSALLQQLAKPVMAGLVLGTLSAAFLSQLLRKELYGISPLDPAAYFVAVGLFSTAVMIAVIVPARRALRIDPLKALRYE